LKKKQEKELMTLKKDVEQYSSSEDEIVVMTKPKMRKKIISYMFNRKLKQNPSPLKRYYHRHKNDSHIFELS
jgi:hypothetical protein